MRIYKIVFLLLLANQLIAQNSIKILTEKKGVSIRGLSVPSETVIWASGSKGSVAKSINGGASFEWLQVKGFENRDFRSIHAWDEKEAVIVAVASPAVVLKTYDGGVHWNIVTEILDSNMFLDAIHFKDSLNGWIVGDPIENNIFLLSTKDKGSTWQEVSEAYFKSNVNEGEAFFASSATNMKHTKDALFMVSGGMSSRLWINGLPALIPITQGTKSTGANSIAISPDENKLIIVGGDFTKDTVKKDNFLCLIKQPSKNNNGAAWQLAKKYQNPNGYRSCVEFIDNKLVVTCGTSGVDISKNGGQNWNLISNQSFHVVQHQPGKKAAFLAGSGGRIGYLTID
jgi:photosystem II stability/assembly factor-like uncharacterized protein